MRFFVLYANLAWCCKDVLLHAIILHVLLHKLQGALMFQKYILFMYMKEISTAMNAKIFQNLE